MHITPTEPANPQASRACLIVTALPDGRYSVEYTDGTVSRHSYTRLVEQVVRQAQRAGGLPIRTDDDEIRRRCQDVGVPLI